MTSSKDHAVQFFLRVAITTLGFLLVNRINELAFLQFEHSAGINWMFIPAGLRVLATLFFGFAGFVGLLLAGFYLNFHHFAFDDQVRAWTGAVAGALGPYLAYLFAKHWYDMGPFLQGLSARRLLVTAVLCGVSSPVLHHAFTWVQTGMVDWQALGIMIVGDSLGILVVLYLAKGMITLTDLREPEEHRQ